MLGEEVLGDAAGDLGDGTTPRALRAALEVSGGTVDDALEVSAHGSTAAEAEERAAAVTASYVEASDGTGTVLNSDAAVRAVAPLGGAAAGAVGGLALGLLLVVLLLNARPRVMGWSSLDGAPARVFPGALPLHGRARRDESTSRC